MTRMGCISSNTVQSSALSSPEKMLKSGETVVQAYVRLDDQINELEKESPGPQLASLATMMQDIQEVNRAEVVRFDEMITRNTSQLSEDPMVQVLLDLQLDRYPHHATEQEEFVANINRQDIARVTKSLVESKFNDMKFSKTKLETDVNKLQLLYREQDLLMERVLGAQYGSVTEKSLEGDLSRLRALRDTLAVGARAWRAGAASAVKAHSSAASGLLSWQLILQSKDTSERARLAIEARNHLISGVHEIRSAQSALPAAQFPHCTSRQLQALTLTLDYMFTDMYSQERFNHATRVFTGFADRTMALATWITEVLKKSLDKDLFEVGEDVNRIAAELRGIRVNLIVEKGFADVLYKPPQDLKAE